MTKPTFNFEAFCKLVDKLENEYQISDRLTKQDNRNIFVTVERLTIQELICNLRILIAEVKKDLKG